ncbi:MAG: hypothetical protein QXG91_00330 [Candidatus Aenigmatarchaeota archaeon]
MKEIIGFIIFAIFMIILILFILSFVFKLDIFKSIVEREAFEETRKTKTIQEKNISGENKSSSESSEEEIARAISEKNREKVIYTKIVDICITSEEQASIVEGSGMDCLNKEEPYNVEIFQLNETNLLLKFDNYTNFISKPSNLFTVFIRGINLVANETNNVYFLPETNFYPKNYTIYTVWISNEIYEISASLPIGIKENSISKKFEEELKFYVNALNKTFYAGSIYIKKN